MKLSHKIMTIIGFSLCLISCTENSQNNNIKLTVSKQDFIIKIPATGELETSASTTIGLPSGVFEPQIIEWLVEENTLVKKGQVVVRFDSTKYVHQSSQEQFQIDQGLISFLSKELVLRNEKGEIISDKSLIYEELQMANDYNPGDLQVFSRNEIIDTMKNMKFLEAKRDYTDWRGESHENKSRSELDLLQLQQDQHTDKLSMYNSALNELEVKAPHDGLFVLSKNWRGDKTRIGDTTWPGRRIASLPDLSKLQAKIFVLESEAAGMKIGQPVEFTLDAYPQKIIKGKVEQVGSIATPREKDSPIKYFEVIVQINNSKYEHLRPGSQLQAIIFAAEIKQVISIPTQSMTLVNGKYFVQVKADGQWKKREVKLGMRNMAKTQILQGLEEGETIALFSDFGFEDKKPHDKKNQGDKNAFL